jgi:hypothetical protein
MKEFNVFKKVNEIIAQKSYKYTLYVIVFLIFGFVYIKSNNVTFGGVRRNLEEVVSEISKKQPKSDKKEDIPIQEIRKKLSKIRKDEEENRRKREEEVGQKDVKKEITPEVVEIRQEDESNVAKQSVPVEEKIQNPVSILSKLQQIEDKYQERLKKKQVMRGRIVKKNDFVYHSMTVSNTIKIREDGDKKNNRTVEAEGGRVFLKMDNNNKMSKFFIGKRVGDTFVIGMDEIINQLEKVDRDEINRSINTGLEEKNPNLKGIDIDITKFKYKMEILDIIPKALIEELKLDEN